MKENKIIIIINKPIEEVFEFTTNTKNTHTRIPSIDEEISSEYPPKVGTRYKNRGENTDWDIYKVVESQKNKVFTLADLDDDYKVRYSYRKIDDNKTEMIYYEWMKKGELASPFTKNILMNLKSVMESKEQYNN